MKKLGIGEELQVRNVEGEAATVKVRIIGKSELVDLADLGYGCGQVLTILLAILKLVNEAGVGPISRQWSMQRHKILLIEEAESNLHPSLQSQLAELFVQAHKVFGVQFILESHSEYLIRSLQLIVANAGNGITSDEVIIYYLDSTEGEVVANPIRIQENGELTDHFGKGFFSEADDKAMELFRLQKQKSRK